MISGKSAQKTVPGIYSEHPQNRDEMQGSNVLLNFYDGILHIAPRSDPESCLLLEATHESEGVVA